MTTRAFLLSLAWGIVAAIALMAVLAHERTRRYDASYVEVVRRLSEEQQRIAASSRTVEVLTVQLADAEARVVAAAARAARAEATLHSYEEQMQMDPVETRRIMRHRVSARWWGEPGP